MRLRRDSKGHFLPRRRRNAGPKGYAKIDAAVQAMARRERLGLRGRRGLHVKAFELGKGIGRRYAQLRNPGPKGHAKTRALRAAILRAGRSTIPIDSPMLHLGSLHKAYMRRRRLSKRSADVRARRARRYEQHFLSTSGASLKHFQHARRLRSAAARRLRVDNPKRRRNPAGLAGLWSMNPRRRARRRKPQRKATSMARRSRRRRTAAQRAAFRRMIAGLKRFKARVGRKSRRRRRRHNPKRGAHSMARRRHRSRRRRAAIVMINPRRRHRRRRNPRRIRHHRRRRNPGMAGGFKGAVKSVFMTAIPALGGGFVANFIDSKFLSDKNIIVRILAKLAQAGLAGAIFRRRPVVAYATMGAIIGSVGGDFGTRMGGGAVVGGTPIAKAQGVAALITEDPRAMGVLVEGMRGMGYQIDSNVSLGDMQPLPSGSYQDVNLG